MLLFEWGEIVRICVHACEVQRSMFGAFLYHFPLSLSNRVSQWTWILPTEQDQLARDSQGCSCLLLPVLGLWAQHQNSFFMKLQTQVPTLEWQAIYPLSHLPTPKLPITIIWTSMSLCVQQCLFYAVGSNIHYISIYNLSSSWTVPFVNTKLISLSLLTNFGWLLVFAFRVQLLGASACTLSVHEHLSQWGGPLMDS